MQFFEKRICVKSTPENWSKENDGLKSNTVRVVPRSEKKDFEAFVERFREAGSMRASKFYINIQNTETGEVFDKMITDISSFDTGKEVVQIISFYSRTPEVIRVPVLPGLPDLSSIRAHVEIDDDLLED